MSRTFTITHRFKEKEQDLYPIRNEVSWRVESNVLTLLVVCEDCVEIQSVHHSLSWLMKIGKVSDTLRVQRTVSKTRAYQTRALPNDLTLLRNYDEQFCGSEAHHHRIQKFLTQACTSH